MAKDVIIALDFADAGQVFAFLDRFPEKKPYVKIGMELYYAEGPEIVRQIKARGHKIFLDPKLHDIPNTVKKAMRVLSNLDVDMVNLHAAGTRAMMEAALEGLTRPDGSRPLLLAVTQLTSTDQAAMESELLIDRPLDQVVMHYAKNAAAAGLDGLLEKYGYRREGRLYRTREGSDETLVFFCHFGVTCVLLSHLFGVSPFILWHSLCMAPSSVTEVWTEEREEGKVSFRASRVGDLSHLDAAGVEPSFSARFCSCYKHTDERH